MVVLGQWPYQHSITLDQLRRQAGAIAYYYVDDDTIISRPKALELERNGYIIDDRYMTVMSEDKYAYIQAYSMQIVAPSPPNDVVEMIDRNMNQSYKDGIDMVSDSGAVLIVNGQDGDLMKDVGAVWNAYLGMWILDSNALRMLREKRREKTDGRIQMRQDKGGILVEIWGDVSEHTNLLMDSGGKYDDEKDIWYIPMSSVHKVMHIVS